MKRKIFFHLVIRWDTKIGVKFLDKTIIIDTHDNDANRCTLGNFIRNEVLKKEPSHQFISSASESEEDIVSIETGSGTDISSFLDEPFEDGWGEFVLGEGNRNGQINAIVARGFIASCGTGKRAAKFAPLFSPIRTNSMVLLKSKFSVEDVTSFLTGYAEAINKKKYLDEVHSRDKPTFDDQIEAYIVKIMCDSELGYRQSNADDEMQVAKLALMQTIAVFREAQKYRLTLSRRRMNLFKSPILVAIKNTHNSGKVTKNPPNLSRVLVRERISGVVKALEKWPYWYKKVRKDDSRLGECIISELENLKMIYLKHDESLQDQQDRNIVCLNRDVSVLPNASNTEFSIRPKRSNLHRVDLHLRTDADIHRYYFIDKLLVLLSNFYAQTDISDEVMGLCNIPRGDARVSGRRKFMKGLWSNKFNIGVFKYFAPGRNSNWITVFRIPTGVDRGHRNVISALNEAAARAPEFLSRRQTLDGIAMIRSLSQMTSRAATALFEVITPDSLSSYKHQSVQRDARFGELSKVIKCDDYDHNDDNMRVLEDSRYFNCSAGNRTKEHKFDLFWKAMAEAIDIDGAGAHRRRHVSSDTQTTCNVAYAPNVNSITQLIDATIKNLSEKKLKERYDYFVPHRTWVALQFSPTYENHLTAQRHTGLLKFKRQLQSKSARSDHPHGHWVAQKKKIWRYHGWKLRSLLEDAASTKDNDVLPWNVALKFTGQDDKTGIPVGRSVPVSATQHNTLRAIVSENTRVLAADHDWKSEKIVPSVTSEFNIGESVGDSLFSGGVDGKGRHSVALHDATFQKSTAFHHAACLLNYLKSAASRDMQLEEQDHIQLPIMPYSLLLETDGGPDHNTTFVQNQLALFALFLLSGVDKFSAIRGCPGLSFLNTVERTMSVLNLGLANLALKIEGDQWLMDNVLAGTASMKGVREAINDYDKEKVQVIDILRRQEKVVGVNKTSIVIASDEMSDEENNSVVASDEMSDEENNSVEENNSSRDGNSGSNDGKCNITSYCIGDIVRKFFRGYGWYEGSIQKIHTISPNEKKYAIIFEDGEEANWSFQELQRHAAEAEIPIGEVGFRFVRKFRGGRYFTGTVIEIKANGKRRCRFCDKAQHDYTLQSLEKDAKNKVNIAPNDESSDSNNSNESEEEEISDSESVMKTFSNLNEKETTTKPNTPALSHGQKRSKYFRSMIGMTSDELLQRDTANVAFQKAISVPINIVAKRFEQLSIDERPISVRKWPDDQSMDALVKALQQYDPEYSNSYRSKSELTKMPSINEFFTSKEHFRETQYSVEFRLCGAAGCHICLRVGRNIRTPATEDGELRKEVLRWLDNPLPNENRKGHYLSPEETREKIDSKQVCLESQLKHLSSLKKDTKETTLLKKDKEEDKLVKSAFAASKLRATVSCDSCGARRCIFSMKAVNATGGPSNEEVEHLQSWIEDGYVCGNKPTAKQGVLQSMTTFSKKFIMKTQLRCGEQIESQYYSTPGVRGRITTESICAICYSTGSSVLTIDEIKNMCNTGGKNPLPICKHCVDIGMPIPTTAGSSNKRRNKSETDAQRKGLLTKAIAKGHKKARK